jgi:UDP-glucose:(heptosyl)LPS alpha-1,3-glucosyltransferase
MTSNSGAHLLTAEEVDMKIGIQIERFDPVAGGAEKYTEQLIRGLLALRHNVHLFAREARSLPGGVRFQAVPVTGVFRWQKDRCFAQNAACLAAAAQLDVLLGMVKTLALDVYQPHGGSILHSQQQNIARIPSSFVRTIKGLFNHINPRQVRAQRLESRFFRRRSLPHVVAVSQMVAADLRTYYDIPDERLHVIYNGVDLERFHPERLAARRASARQAFSLPDNALVFALVAHNFKLKGVAELIRAAALLNATEQAFCVVIAGKASPRRYREMARKQGCHDRVRFTGPLEAVEDLYAAADVYVHPTWYDPCSLVVLEALAAGLPVITTRCNGASEIMTDGQDGLLLDTPADVARLADRMGYFLEPHRTVQMGRQARSLAEQFPWDRNISAMVRVLELAAEEKRQNQAGA